MLMCCVLPPLNSALIAGLCRHVSEVTISNGLEWSLDNTMMYYIDSKPYKVYSFKYDASTGQISDKKVIIDYSADEALGTFAKYSPLHSKGIM